MTSHYGCDHEYIFIFIFVKPSTSQRCLKFLRKAQLESSPLHRNPKPSPSPSTSYTRKHDHNVHCKSSWACYAVSYLVQIVFSVYCFLCVIYMFNGPTYISTTSYLKYTKLTHYKGISSYVSKGGARGGWGGLQYRSVFKKMGLYVHWSTSQPTGPLSTIKLWPKKKKNKPKTLSSFLPLKNGGSPFLPLSLFCFFCHFSSFLSLSLFFLFLLSLFLFIYY